MPFKNPADLDHLREELRKAAPGRGSSAKASSRLPSTKRHLVRVTVEPPTTTRAAPASAAKRICARLSLRAGLSVATHAAAGSSNRPPQCFSQVKLRSAAGWELSEMTVHPENIVSSGENSLKASSSCRTESGDRCGKKRRWKLEPSGHFIRHTCQN